MSLEQILVCSCISQAIPMRLVIKSDMQIFSMFQSQHLQQSQKQITTSYSAIIKYYLEHMSISC